MVEFTVQGQVAEREVHILHAKVHFRIQAKEKEYCHMSFQHFVAWFVICHWDSTSAAPLQQLAWSGISLACSSGVLPKHTEL